ncbi:ABC transporter permease [Oharaeibacter diazotrophicus]|uniref:NitT/TauT family transport system permease protein n=1 Tax=Oharaeibacter diazotrophicus TaxID=1920512 RepID=A0A4R6RLK8_9HYPH|nr:ABC transporter permease [Oharaeibacter diazotrophicus]TDP87549.1 NitT/TauT family transport system permease protein [Oharaeibacter diazotrophicus]BBE70506.1 putative aliphatic sulfonates transport permease protein SsuC [Pleomorphomonas sp. SM30]GLS77252.1 ABC transporter permease [Oharaeibacter diazotrophicus]
MSRSRASIATTAASVAALIALWSVVSLFAERRVLPPPWEVAAILVAEIRSGELPWHLYCTLTRVVAAFTVAMALGSAIGLAMGRNRVVDRALDVWLVVLLNLPALVVIILAYVWFGLTEAAAIGAVALNKLPNVIVTVREGARALDPDLDQMAAAFRLSARKRLTEIVLPQLQPYLAAAARSGLSLVWKIVLVVELLGRSNGVGFQLNIYFQLFDVASILAYALSFVVVMLAIELAVLQPLETRANRWRVRTA